MKNVQKKPMEYKGSVQFSDTNRKVSAVIEHEISKAHVRAVEQTLPRNSQLLKLPKPQLERPSIY